MSSSIYRWVIAWAGLALCVGLVATITMWPAPVDQGYGAAIDKVLTMLHNRGVPEWFGYSKLEFTSNIVMFIPLGFFLTLSFPHKYWWIALILIPALSGSIEWAQGQFLSQRFSSPLDVIANTTGGYIGVLCAMALWGIVNARDEHKLRSHNVVT